jgi:hypothetical protein
MGKRHWLALLACVAVACGGSSGSSGTSEGAAVSGYVYEGSPVVVVGIAADAPVGDVPVANAEVRAVNLHGTTLATVLSGADGSFRFEGLPPGYLSLEVRKVATSVSADASAEVTGIGGEEIAVNAPHAITRDAAIAAALAVVPPDTRVICSLQPFPAGTRIAPAGGDPGSTDPVPTVGRTLPADEWFLLVDLFPGASYAHPLEYVFVDAATGAVARETDVQWPPLANGADFWGGEWSLVGAEGIDILSVDPEMLPADQAFLTSPEVVREPPTMLPAPLLAGPADAGSADILSALALHNTDPASIFVILWRAGWEEYRVRSLLEMLDLFEGANVPIGNIRIVTPTPNRVAMQDSGYIAALQSVNALIQQRMQQGLHSTLVVWIGSHGGGSWFGRYHGPGSNDFQTTQAADLQLTTTMACKVRVILDFCFARDFGEILAGLFDGMQPAERPDYVVYCACAKTEFCYALPYHYESLSLGFLDVGCRFTNELTETATVANGDITGCLNPTGTGIVDGLSSLLGTLNFISNNAVQHPSAIVRRGWPARCIAAGTTGLVLDQNLTAQLVAGTFIPLSEIQGGFAAAPDACATQHFHSQTGITIAGVGGPFPDPNPTGCGYGAVVTR